MKLQINQGGKKQPKPDLNKIITAATDKAKLDYAVAEIQRLGKIIEERDSTIEIVLQTVSSITMSAAQAEGYLLKVMGVRITRERIRNMRKRGEISVYGEGRNAKYPVIELISIAHQLKKKGGSDD